MSAPDSRRGWPEATTPNGVSTRRLSLNWCHADVSVFVLGLLTACGSAHTRETPAAGWI
jgi:hypothetical protein